MALTVGEHDDLWKHLYSTIPNEARNIYDSLRRANGIEILKELRNIGVINDEFYINSLKKLLRDEGFTID